MYDFIWLATYVLLADDHRFSPYPVKVLWQAIFNGYLNNLWHIIAVFSFQVLLQCLITLTGGFNPKQYFRIRLDFTIPSIMAVDWTALNTGCQTLFDDGPGMGVGFLLIGAGGQNHAETAGWFYGHLATG